MAPWEVRDAGTSGKLALEDAWEAVCLEVGIGGAVVDHWLRREMHSSRSKRVAEAKRLVGMLRAGVGDREEIVKRLEEINRGVKAHVGERRT